MARFIRELPFAPNATRQVFRTLGSTRNQAGQGVIGVLEALK